MEWSANCINGLGYPEYGYLWWKNYFDINEKHIQGYQAQGNGGQMVFVFPDFDMVVVFTAGNYGNPRMINAFEILENDILPSLFQLKKKFNPIVEMPASNNKYR